LLAELTPTVKIISELRQWYPNGFLVGWKFEVEGDRTEVIRLAERQLAECRTNVCVANGAGYGPGFGIVRPGGECRHTPDTRDLFATLDELLQSL
jgi:phosphopantothenoylcysteine decarboxylase/phosphopantothenate--cysteine ligase